MATRHPDPELSAAIRAHLASRHQRELEPAQIAPERRGRLATATLVTYLPGTPEEPAWFTCLLCPAGGRRYCLDLFATPEAPPARHLRAIRAHFVEAHAVADLPTGRVDHGPASAAPALWVYLPASPARAASFICERCPKGMNRILLGLPAYGDARRLAWLLRAQPELHTQIAGLAPADRAIRLEGIDRGLQTSVGQRALAKAVLKARAGARATPREAGPIERALGALILSRVRKGSGPTEAIRGLAAMIETDHLGYARLVAEAMPDMAPFLGKRDDDLARLLKTLYGEHLERSERALWGIWSRIPDDERRRAREGG